MPPKHFQSDNAKYTNKSTRTDTHNPEFNPTIQVNGKKELGGLERNQQKWVNVVAYYR